MTIPLLLHGRHAGPAVVYQPFGPWIVPWRFSGWEEEYRALKTGVGLIDWSRLTVIECRGRDRTEFLQRLLTNDVKRLAPGTGCCACLLTPSANVLADLLVLAEQDVLQLLCDVTRADAVAQTLERYRFSDEVDIVNCERRQAVLALQGPGTGAFLTRLTGTTVPLHHLSDHSNVSVRGVPLKVIRHALASDEGILCVMDSEQVETAWILLQQEGLKAGVRLVGWEALNAARIEAGVPWFGVDLDDSNLLPETGLEAMAVSETKGCYIGQEIVARMQTYGSPSKKLVGLRLSRAGVPAAGDRIVKGDQPLGRITSACDSPALRQPIAMGYVKRGAYEPETAVEVVGDDARWEATVVSRPIVS